MTAIHGSTMPLEFLPLPTIVFPSDEMPVALSRVRPARSTTKAVRYTCEFSNFVRRLRMAELGFEPYGSRRSRP